MVALTSGSSGDSSQTALSNNTPPSNEDSQQARLLCPRCESPNTKFCYYNNKKEQQPRHFCKNCRRYWTKGGALRNVPIGGGCRKNKRMKHMTYMSTTSRVFAPTSYLGSLPRLSTNFPSFAGPSHVKNDITPLPTLNMDVLPSARETMYAPHLRQNPSFVGMDSGYALNCRMCSCGCVGTCVCEPSVTKLNGNICYEPMSKLNAKVCYEPMVSKMDARGFYEPSMNMLDTSICYKGAPADLTEERTYNMLYDYGHDVTGGGVMASTKIASPVSSGSHLSSTSNVLPLSSLPPNTYDIAALESIPLQEICPQQENILLPYFPKELQSIPSIDYCQDPKSVNLDLIQQEEERVFMNHVLKEELSQRLFDADVDEPCHDHTVVQQGEHESITEETHVIYLPSGSSTTVDELML